MNIKCEYTEKSWKNIPLHGSTCFRQTHKQPDYEQIIDKILTVPYNENVIHHITSCEEVFYENDDQAYGI